MTEKKAAIGDKENSPAASNRPKHRSRRVEGELRQRLLKQNFEQQHFKSSLVSAAKEVKEAATSNNNPQPPNSAIADQKQHPVRISCEEKVKQIRHKLEKIVHKREPNESKAIGYLSTLDSMRLTPQVVANTRVDLVIEALIGMAKDSAVVAKAKDSLARLKAVTEVREKITVKDALQYRDPAEEARRKAKKEEAERRRNSPKKYTATSSLLSLVGSEHENVVGEAGESSVDQLPSMRGLDYWMNKMVSDMAKLDVLGQQVGRIEKVVEIEAKQQQQQQQKQQQQQQQQEQKAVEKEANQKQQQQQEQKAVEKEAKQKQQQQQEQKVLEKEAKQKQQQEQKAVEKEAKQKQQQEQKEKQQQQQEQKAVEKEAKQKQQQQQEQKAVEKEAKQKQQQEQKEKQQQQQEQQAVEKEAKQKQQQQQEQKVVEKSRKEQEGGRRNGEKLMAGKGRSKLEEDLLQITATVGRIAIREETEKIPSVKAR
jgi:hypothetical protein